MIAERMHICVMLLACLAVKVAVGSEIPSGSAVCDQIFTPSGLLAVSSECDGKHVVVRGFLRVGPEMRGLWDSRRDIELANYRDACITVYNPHGLKISSHVRLADVSGIFHARRPPRLFILGACTDAIIEIDRVKDIKEPD